MRIAFDPGKDSANRAKHGMSLAAAEVFEWQDALVWPDTRRTYGELRQCAIGYIGLRLHVVVFVDRDEGRRVISLRKANRKEERLYANT